MTWRLEFHRQALREYQRLDQGIRTRFHSQLETLLGTSPGPGSDLHGPLLGCGKIKLRKDGYRLVYYRNVGTEVIRVLSVGRRDSDVYSVAISRLSDST